MTNRSVSIVLLFFATLAATGVLVAMAVSVDPQLGIASRAFLVPVVTFVTFVLVFFLARTIVLPPVYATPAWRALVALSVWMGLTLVGWQAALWALRPLMRTAGGGRGTLLVLLGCLLLSVKVLDRAGASRGRRLLP
jgi:hypothetical protein